MSGGQGLASPCRQVLVTRPEPGASDTAVRLRALRFVPVLAPVTEIVRLRPELPPPDAVQAVLATSANALPGLEPYRDRLLLAVGDATATAARLAGHTRVESAAGDARALAALAERLCAPSGGTLFLPTAEGQGESLAAALAACGFGVERRAVYAARRVAHLPEAAREALLGDTLAAALFFSAETARSFVALVEEAGLASRIAGIEACVIAPSAADALAPLPWRRIRVALQPNQNDLLALLS